MRQNEAITRAYLTALSGLNVPIYTAIPNSAPALYVYIPDVTFGSETTTKTEFEYPYQIILEIHAIGDAYNATKLAAVKLAEAVFAALQPQPNAIIAVDSYQMVRQSLASTRTDETLFTSNKVIRKILIFDGLISK